jgi:protein disulfide-isomerase A6
LLSVSNVADATKELDPSSFEELTKSGKNGMIKFFQPWCGHCTAMKPAWDQLAESVDASVFIADVNCSDQEDLCSKNDVKGYPTIKVYQNGEVSDYKGGRSFEQLMEYVDENLAQKCNVENLAENCSEKAVKYAEKWKGKPPADVSKELKRLSGMTDSSMSSDLKKWLRERLNILRQLAPPSSEDEEL